MNDRKSRNCGIELFRILMMFGIVMLHVCGQGKYGCVWPANILRGAVVCFVFISGYYGIRFTLSKLVGLYSLAVFYCCLEPIIGGVVPLGYEYLQAVLDAWRAQEGYWFLHAYAILMTIAPLIDNTFKGAESRKALLASIGFLLVVFGWSYMTCFSHLSRLVPRPLGMTANGSIITMLGIYVAGRLFRSYGLERRISTRMALIGFASMFVLISITRGYLSPYASPFQLLLSACLFCLFFRMRLPEKLGQIILFAAPSMFGVYLLHAMLYLPGMENKVYTLINAIRDPLIDSGVSRHLVYITVAIFIFLISFVIDVMRRLVLLPIRSHIRAINASIDRILS